MAVTAVSLVARYPEFEDAVTAYPAMVDACIAEAALMVDGNVYGDKADMAVTSYAAHLIALNPIGELARLDKKSDKTTYLIHFTNIKKSVAAGFRVL